VVDKAFVQGFYNRREVNIFVSILKNGSNAVGLFYAVAAYIETVAFLQVAFTLFG